MNENRSHTLALLLIVLALPVAAVLLGCALASCATSRVAAAAPIRIVQGSARRPVSMPPTPPQFPFVTAVGRGESGLYIITAAPEAVIVEASQLYEDGSIAVTGMYPAETINGPYWEHFETWVEWVLNHEVGHPCVPSLVEDEPPWTNNPEGFARILTGTILADLANEWRAEFDDDDVPGWGDWRPGAVCYPTYSPVIAR